MRQPSGPWLSEPAAALVDGLCMSGAALVFIGFFYFVQSRPLWLAEGVQRLLLGKIAISAHMNPSIYFAMCSAANRVIGVPLLLGLLLAFRFQTGVFQILGVAMILTDGTAGLAIWLKLRSDLGGDRLAQL